MARQRRSFLLLILAALFAGGSIAGASLPALRLIAAANVTVRLQPSPQSPAIAQLPLGTEVTEAGDADLDKTWVRIVTPEGKTGWVLAGLTRPLDPFWKWQTQERVITERLARTGDGFPAAVELVAFIERIADAFTDTDGRARMDLYHLQAMRLALRGVPFNQSRREPYASWLARYKGWAVYSEPGGVWLVANAAIWKVHGARAGTPAADEIAWFARGAGLPGECEGYLPCYLDLRNRLDGEYLRKHPAGAHAGEAVAAIGQTVGLLSAPPEPRSAYSFDPKADCRTFSSSVDALTEAVRSAKGAAGRETTLASLAALRKKCQ